MHFLHAPAKLISSRLQKMQARLLLFALAQWAAATHMSRAFQASSPKNFQGPVLVTGLFFCLRRLRTTFFDPGRNPRETHLETMPKCFYLRISGETESKCGRQ